MLFAGAAVAAEDEIVYTAQRGDTLIGIGARLLEQPRDWREVARINRIADPNRIMPTQPIRIPVRLLRGTPVPGRVVQVVGDARLVAPDGSARAAQIDAEVVEGSRVVTGSDGYVTVRLADGSTLRMQASSDAELAQARRLGDGGHRSLWRLLSGRLEALVTQVTGGAPRFEVRTPQAVVAVRGTDFRVAADGATAITRSEVLTGTVDFGADAAAGSARLEAGFGARVDAERRVSAPVPLLPAPDVAALPALLERILVRLPLPRVAGAAHYRAQVAFDRDFQRVAAEQVSSGPELRFSQLDDADYFLRVRAIDAGGLEGRDALHVFRLKARPEPPTTTMPTPRARLPVPRVEFAWTAHPQARSYRFQLSHDAAFASIARREDSVPGTSLVLDALAAGTWYWRVATVRESGGAEDRGPWGDPQQFELRALPKPPGPPAVDAATVRLAWGGEPGQRFEFQLARDPAFSAIVLEQQLAEPAIAFPRPAPGVYHLRYRAIDADGYVGPYIAPQRLELYNCVRDSRGGCIGSGADALRAP